FVPIQAQDVAKAMIYQVFSYQEDPVIYLHRREMLDLIKHYD
ncbi:oxidoreductase, partial [Vibrio campbellii]|nr:oxidoreductase [Vibrio campbellii]